MTELRRHGRGVKQVWTEEMDSVILESIQEQGVDKGLQLAGEILDINWFTCRNRWYKTLKNSLRGKSHKKPLKRLTDPATGRYLKIKQPVVEEVVSKSDNNKYSQDMNTLTENLDIISRYISNLVNSHNEMEGKLQDMQAQLDVALKEKQEANDNYQAVLKVINQARIQFVQDEVNENSHVFQMERNGNLVTKG